MKIGSIVHTVADFEELRVQWGFPYPKKGDVLTVSSIAKHPNNDVDKAGVVLLNFEELPSLVGVCDKKIDGKPNFLELILPGDIEEILKAPIEMDEDETLS